MFKGNLKLNLEPLERLFETKAPPLIGCDITSSAVKMVEIAAAGKGQYRLERYVIEPLPRDAVEDGNINNLDAVSDCLTRGWKRMGTSIRNVALALPSAAVITRKIIVPAGQPERELELQVETEANQYVPFALEEVNLDFQVIGPAPNSPDDIEILIAASRKDKIEDRVAAAAAADLKAVVMDIDTFAAQAAFELIEVQLPQTGEDRTVAIIDIGSAVMTLNVMRKGQSIYVREQPFGGNQLTQEIQSHFGMSPEEAEAAKRAGGLPDNYETDVLAPFLDRLGLEVARALQFFFASTQFNQIDHILLTGGCAAIPGIDEVVTKRAAVNAMVANPFANMMLSSKIRPKQLTSDAPLLMVACGLAMRRFDT